MIVEFLTSYKENLLTSKADYESQLDSIRTKIKENEKFLALLSDENNMVFSDFSPRDVEDKHKVRIHNLNEELQKLYDERIHLTNCINDIDTKLYDLEDVITAASLLEENNSMDTIDLSGNETDDTLIESDGVDNYNLLSDDIDDASWQASLKNISKDKRTEGKSPVNEIGDKEVVRISETIQMNASDIHISRKNLISTLDRAIAFISIDPTRSKIELENLKKNI